MGNVCEIRGKCVGNLLEICGKLVGAVENSGYISEMCGKCEIIVGNGGN